MRIPKTTFLRLTNRMVLRKLKTFFYGTNHEDQYKPELKNQ